MNQLHRRRFLQLSSACSLSGAFLGCASTTPKLRGESDASHAPVASEAFERALRETPPLALPPAPSAADYVERIARARTQLQTQNIAALVITPSTNLRYFTGISWWLSERFFAWVLPQEGDPFLVVPAFERSRTEERQAAAKTRAEIVVWREHENPYAVLQRTLEAKGGPTRAHLDVDSGATIAIDPAAPLRFAAGLRASLGRQRCIEGAAVTEAVRAVKTPVEIRCLEVANEITLAALRLVFTHLRLGLDSTTIADWVRRAQVHLGGENPWVLSLVGEAAAFPHGTKRAHVLEGGRGLLVDTGISVHGYQSDLTRTVVFGEPKRGGDDAKAFERFIAAHGLVHQAQARALAAIRPGVLPSHVDAVARQFLADNGYGPEDKFFTHRLGHGIGLDGHEAPYLVGGNDRPFGEGNCASCEPGVYVPGAFGIRLEDIFVVEKTGARTLVRPQSGPFVDDV